MESFYDVFESVVNLHANLKKAPRLTTKVLHPCNCKQNVPNALAIFNETTIAAWKSYFPEKASAAALLTLFSKWWVYLIPKLGIQDKKLSFLRAVTDWVQNWQEKKIPNCEKFTAFSNRFAIRENIKIPCFAYRRFGCGRI